MAWTRASQLDRTFQCPGHLTLPHRRELSENALNAAEYGNLVHRWAETGVVSGSKSHCKTFEKKLAVLQANGITRETLWNVAGWHEVTFAYNCVDGRLGVCWLRGEVANEYKKQHNDDWITGTADYVYLKNGLCGVNDLKTGMMYDSQPDELSQLYFYLMCWQKYTGVCQSVNREDGYLEVNHWPKYPIDALPCIEERRVSADRMIKFERFIMKLHKDYKNGSSPFVLGAECEYCPAQEDCPLLNQNNSYKNDEEELQKYE